jgi:hypothetical protein
LKYTNPDLEVTWVKPEVTGKLSNLTCMDIPNQLALPDNGGKDEEQEEGSDDNMDLSGLVD